MSLQKKYCRKSLPFLTPQSRKTQSSQQKLSSSNDQTPEHLLGNLLNDPLKRALLMEVLSQDSPKTKKIGIKDVESKKNQKFKYESPSALCRRRALAKMQGPSSSSDVNNTIKHKFVKVPFNKILKGVTAYVEITSHGKDRSAGVKSLMRAMGADIRDVFCRDLTHVVFKDGLYNSYQKARLLKVHLVSVLWVDAARRHECRMPEKYYPAIGSNTANVNVSLICQQFQKDYEDVLQEELNRSKNLSESILPDIHSEDVINTSQNCDAHSISIKKKTKCKPIAVTPNSMYLDSTPYVTSDTDSEHYFIDNKKSFQKNINKESDNGICTKDIADQNTKNANTDLSNLNIKLSETCSQIEELSSLRISTDSDRNTDKQRIPQAVLDFQNVTQRKKKVDIKNKVNILEQHVLMPNISSTTEASCEKELNDNVENNNFLEKEINYDIDFAQEVNHKMPLKKIVRKLYNPDDIDISICGENTELKFTNKASPILSNVSDENTSNTEKNKKEIQNDVLNKRSSLTTPKNVSNLKMKKFATTPRRRSSRLFQYQNTESPQKRLRRSSIDENYTLNVIESDENDALLVTNNKQIANDIINNDEVGYMGENEENCNISGKLKTPVNKTASKNHCTSRRTLDFEADKCKNSPLKNNTISKSILQRNNTVTTSEEEKHNDIFVEPKNNSFLKSSRRSARISSFRNVHTTPKKESVTQAGSNKKTPGKKNIINNESLNRKNGKLAENNVDSSDEFIYNQIENQKSSYDRECSSDNLLNKNSSGKKKLDVSNSNDDATTTNTQHKSFPYKLRRSTADFIPKEPIQTQNRFKNNTPNSKLKLTQRNKPLKKTSIVCTRFHSTEVQVFQQIVKKLGVFFVEDEVTEKTTHLVVAEPRRTVNLLRAIARGCWILKSEWLYRSLEANHWLSEEDYELCDFSNAVQKSRQERQAFGAKFSVDIFQNCGRIYVSRETNPRCSDLQELVTLCKGTITTITRNADIIVGEYIENKSCVTVNWIMDSVTFYKRKSLKNYVIDPPTSD